MRVPVFCYFCVSENLHKNILGIGQNESQSSYLPDTKTESKGETEEDQEAVIVRVKHTVGNPKRKV
jgi:hypothetical protein